MWPSIRHGVLSAGAFAQAAKDTVTAVLSAETLSEVLASRLEFIVQDEAQLI